MKGIEQHNPRWFLLWAKTKTKNIQVLVYNFCLTTASRGTKFDLTDYYLFNFILVPFAPVSWNVSCHTTLPLETDYLILSWRF